MIMPTLPNMGLETPVAGADSGTWDDKINASFVKVDDHDHTSSKGLRITPAAMNINADLSVAGFSITSLGKLSFSEIAAPIAGSKNLFVSSVDHELYWRSNAGANVKLTSGASINTSLVGGIVGDYASVGAEVAFDDANKRYTFKDQTSPSKKWARLASGPVRIFEYNTTESVYVEHAVDAALAAAYTVTWPAALPGAQTIVQISSAGAVSFSNTFANLDITFSGTGHIKHGSYTEIHPVTQNGWFTDSGSAPARVGTGNPLVDVPNSSVNYYPIDLGNNKRRVLAIIVYGRAFATGDTTLKLYSSSGIGSGTESLNALNLSGATTGTTLVVSPDSLFNPRTLTLSSPETLPQGGEQMYIYVAPGGGSGHFEIVSYGIVFDITT